MLEWYVQKSGKFSMSYGARGVHAAPPAARLMQSLQCMLRPRSSGDPGAPGFRPRSS
eukprot:SAG11_NODE_18694_length_483_cov_2.304688_1_plen_56_part_01